MSNSMPLVSVIMPFYNGHEHVVQSVRSVLSQTYPDYELVIVNDGSKAPALAELLADLDLSKVRIIDHEKNKGLSATRNTAFEQAKGELILPLDCDDMIAPEFLSETVKAIEENPDCSIYTQVRIFGDLEMDWTPDATMLNLMCGIPIPSTVLFKKRIFDLVGGYDPRVKCVPDVEFWIRVLSKGEKLFRVEKPLYHYRKHADSLSDEGKLTEVQVLAEINPDLYKSHWQEVCALEKAKYDQLRDEYETLRNGYMQMYSGHLDLFERTKAIESQLKSRNKLSIEAEKQTESLRGSHECHTEQKSYEPISSSDTVENMFEFISEVEKKYFRLKAEYKKLDLQFKALEQDYSALLKSYDSSVSSLQKLGLRYQLNKLFKL